MKDDASISPFQASIFFSRCGCSKKKRLIDTQSPKGPEGDALSNEKSSSA
jgi:hypothetical protein